MVVYLYVSLCLSPDYSWDKLQHPATLARIAVRKMDGLNVSVHSKQTAERSIFQSHALQRQVHYLCYN